MGDRAHYVPYTDRYPCTVVEVSPSGHQITLREDRATCTDPDLQPGGFAPVHGPRQRWECHEDPAMTTEEAVRRISGDLDRAA